MPYLFSKFAFSLNKLNLSLLAETILGIKMYFYVFQILKIISNVTSFLYGKYIILDDLISKCFMAALYSILAL